MNVEPQSSAAFFASDTATQQAARFRKYRYSPAMIPIAVAVLDLVAILLAGATTSALFAQLAPSDAASSVGHVVTISFIATVYMMLGQYHQLFSVRSIMKPLEASDDVILAQFCGICFFSSAAAAFDILYQVDFGFVLTLSCANVAAVVAMRLAGREMLRGMERRRLIGRNLALLGANAQSQRFLENYERTQPYFTSFLGVYADGADNDGGADMEIVGSSERLIQLVRMDCVDDVVVTLPWTSDAQVAATVERLKELPVNVYLGPDLIGFDMTVRHMSGCDAVLPIFEITRRPISGWSSMLKTLEDYILSACLVILLSPLLLVIAALIKLDSPGPVFFLQERLGFNNKVFRIYKFRSMKHRKVPERRVKQTSRHDPRVTRVGRYLRSTSLDELPQLFNVLNGTMSLVGPRPHAVSHNEEYGRQIRGYFARHRVKPGLTGWAQVNGLRGETDVLEKMEARVRHDIYYADNWSLLFDIRILIMTAVTVLFQKSAY